MKNVLLLGGNGFLGCNLVAELKRRSVDFSVSVFDIFEPKNSVDGVRYYKGTLSETEKITQILKQNKINVLVHMVSTIIPGSSLQDYVNNADVVQLATVPLMNFCAQNNIEFVFLSSGGTVYGVKGGVISENEPTAPISYYGLSKVQIEDLINFYHRRYDLNYLILRPSNPYGHGQNLYGKQGVIAVILGRMLKNQPITIFGDGETIRDYIYIEDFIFYVAELIKEEILNETINIGSGVGYSLNDIVSVVDDISGHTICVEHIEARKDDVPKMILSTTRLHNFIHHEDVKLADGIKRFHDFVMAEKNKGGV